VFLGLAALVAFISWFQMRLAENERLEKLELDELVRAKGGSSLFETRDSEVFPARRAREQFEKFLVPGFCVLLCLLEVGGAWVLWRWTGKTAGGLVPERALPALAGFAFVALVLFTLGRFSVTIARLENERLLRPSGNFLLAGAYVCFWRAGDCGFRGRVSPGGFLPGAGPVRAAGVDGAGTAGDAAAGNLPAAVEGAGVPAAV